MHDNYLKGIIDGVESNRFDSVDFNDPAYKLNNEQLTVFSEWIKSCKNIRYLSLGNGSVDSYDLAVITKALEGNTSLKELNISLSENGSSNDFLENIANFVVKNKNLHGLVLGLDNLSNQGMESIVKIFDVNNSLERCDLTRCNLNDEHVERVGKSLEANSNLKWLNLSHNNIGPKGAGCLANALKNNKSLLELRLSNNNIGNKGVIEIAKSLGNNKTLMFLDVSCNDIDSKGFVGLSDMLKNNHTLRALIVDDNDIKNPLGIDESLEVNETIVLLSLNHIKMNTDGIENITKAIENNKNLVLLYLHDDIKSLCKPDEAIDRLNATIDKHEFLVAYPFKTDDNKILTTAFYGEYTSLYDNLDQYDNPDVSSAPVVCWKDFSFYETMDDCKKEIIQFKICKRLLDKQLSESKRPVNILYKIILFVTVVVLSFNLIVVMLGY